MVSRIHIMGASGSGVTTLGAALAKQYAFAHLDTDDFFWLPTNPPNQQRRERASRVQMLTEAFDAHARWVLSGYVGEWGNLFIPRYELVVFLHAPTALRLQRLSEREKKNHGESALCSGGAMHKIHLDFMNYAAAYDEGSEEIRSLRCHEKWLKQIACPVLRLENTATIEDLLEKIDPWIVKI